MNLGAVPTAGDRRVRHFKFSLRERPIDCAAHGLLTSAARRPNDELVIAPATRHHVRDRMTPAEGVR
jgi:hypothetical protein